MSHPNSVRVFEPDLSKAHQLTVMSDNLGPVTVPITAAAMDLIDSGISQAQQEALVMQCASEMRAYRERLS